MQQPSIWLGAALLLASEAVFAAISAGVKYLSEDVSQAQLVFFRNLFALLPLLPWLLRHRLSALHTEVFGLHLFRAATGLGAMYLFFYIIANAPLANAAMVLMLSPFFIPLVARYWLGESSSKITLLAIALGCTGVSLCLWPDDSQTGTWWSGSNQILLLTVAAALLIACSKVTIRKMSATEPSRRIVAYFALLSCVIAAMPLFWAWQPLGVEQWSGLVVIGLAATLGQLMMTRAFALAPAARIGLLSYTSILFAALLGYLLWQETPEQLWYFGSSLIIAAGFISIRQRLL